MSGLANEQREVESPDEETEDGSRATKNEAHPGFLQCPSKACEFVVLLVYDGYEKHE